MTIGPDLSDFSKEEIRDALAEVRHPIDVAVWSIENYFNLGSIVRVSHNFLVRTIYAVDIPYYYKRADMGTHKYENIVKLSLEEFLAQTKDRNIVAFERRAKLESQDLRAFQWPSEPIAFFGSEKTGVPDLVLERAHSVVSIPMFGVHNDQNVAVAAGIGIYDFVAKHYGSVT